MEQRIAEILSMFRVVPENEVNYKAEPILTRHESERLSQAILQLIREAQIEEVQYLLETYSHGNPTTQDAWDTCLNDRLAELKAKESK